MRRAALGLLLVAVLVRVFLLRTYVVENAAMAPALLEGDVVLVYTGPTQIAPGEVLVAAPDDRTTMVSRVVAHGPATVEIHRGSPVIDGQRIVARDLGQAEVPLGCATVRRPVAEETLGERSFTVMTGHDSVDPIGLVGEEVYLVNDNRLVTGDSRVWGPIEAGRVVGVVLAIVASRDACTGSVRWKRTAKSVR